LLSNHEQIQKDDVFSSLLY